MNKKQILFELPSWARAIQVGINRAWQFLFPRDRTHLRAQQTDRISQAHYKSGDIIIRQGEMPEALYVIECGEVEVVAIRNRARPEVVNILGPQSFFGDDALLKYEPARFAIRARTSVKALVMGRTLFAKVSKTLLPLRDAIATMLNSSRHLHNTEALFSNVSVSR